MDVIGAINLGVDGISNAEIENSTGCDTEQKNNVIFFVC